MSVLEGKLQVGTKIRIGEKCAQVTGFTPGEVIELVEGYFDEYNGLYTYTSSAPSLYDEESGEYDSIFHLFGNQLEYFLDCEIITKTSKLK